MKHYGIDNYQKESGHRVSEQITGEVRHRPSIRHRQGLLFRWLPTTMRRQTNGSQRCKQSECEDRLSPDLLSHPQFLSSWYWMQALAHMHTFKHVQTLQLIRLINIFSFFDRISGLTLGKVRWSRSFLCCMVCIMCSMQGWEARGQFRPLQSTDKSLFTFLWMVRPQSAVAETPGQ